MPNGFKISVSPRTTRFVLVDYDNVRGNHSSSAVSLQTIITHMVNRLMCNTEFLMGIKSGERIKTRLYGGWFEENKTTKLAQDLNVEIRQDFPFQFTLPQGNTIKVECERADRLLSVPDRPLYATYRVTDAAGEVVFRKLRCCTKAEEAFVFLENYCNQRKCPSCHASSMRRIVEKCGQKMVDSMMLCDIEYLLGKGNTCVALISSDADMLPILFQAEANKRCMYYIRDLTPENSFLYLKYYSNQIGKYCKVISWDKGE